MFLSSFSSSKLLRAVDKAVSAAFLSLAADLVEMILPNAPPTPALGSGLVLDMFWRADECWLVGWLMSAGGAGAFLAPSSVSGVCLFVNESASVILSAISPVSLLPDIFSDNNFQNV